MPPALALALTAVSFYTYHEARPLLVTNIEGYDVVLGKPWLSDHNPSIDWCLHTIELCAPAPGVEVSPAVSQGGPPQAQEGTAIILQGQIAPPRVFLLSADQLRRELASGECEVWAGALAKKTPPDQRKKLPPIAGAQPVLDRTQLDQVLTQFADVFAPLPAGLPPARTVDHAITLEPGAKPTWRPTYRKSPAKLQEVRKQLDDLLDKGWIRPSLSPYGAPILFVRKKEGTLRIDGCGMSEQQCIKCECKCPHTAPFQVTWRRA